jgi:hypothetical protein
MERDRHQVQEDHGGLTPGMCTMASAASEHRANEQGHAHADLYDESHVRVAGSRSSQKSFAHENSLQRRLKQSMVVKSPSHSQLSVRASARDLTGGRFYSA